MTITIIKITSYLRLLEEYHIHNNNTLKLEYRDQVSSEHNKFKMCA